MTLLSHESFGQFDRALRRASLERWWRWLSRRPLALLAFDEVRALLGLSQVRDRGRQEIELASIVGTVARREDFTRAFRPRKAFSRQRWRQVYDLLATRGFEPITLYQVGGVFFVVDGHHRVSVARFSGVQSLEAHITEWVTSVRIERDDSLERIRARLSRRCRALCAAPCA